VYFRRLAKRPHGLDSVPAWGLVLDEYDELAQVNIPVAEERVGAAPNPMIRRIGVPTLDGIGIDAGVSGERHAPVAGALRGVQHWQRMTMANLRWEQTDPKRTARGGCA
jgi:hypothetical protein